VNEKFLTHWELLRQKKKYDHKHTGWGQGCQTSFGKGLQPLLQAGSRAARLEIAINGIPLQDTHNSLNWPRIS